MNFSVETIKAFLTEFCETNENGAKFFKYSTQLTNIARRDQVNPIIRFRDWFDFIFSWKNILSGRTLHRSRWLVWIQWFFGRRDYSKYASLFVAFFGRNFGVAAIVYATKQRTFNNGKGLPRCVHWASFDDGITFARQKWAARSSQSFSTRSN